MRTVQMTLDDDLVKAIDREAMKLGTSRSGFTRKALREALTRARERALEDKHRTGYARRPAQRDEFNIWESEQVWPEP